MLKMSSSGTSEPIHYLDTFYGEIYALRVTVLKIVTRGEFMQLLHPTLDSGKK